MEYIIKTKRDGQAWNETGYLTANNWQEAKKKFTTLHREEASASSDFIYFENKEECNDHFNFDEWEGVGYYPEFTADKIIDNKNVSTIRNDVYVYTINRVS